MNKAKQEADKDRTREQGSDKLFDKRGRAIFAHEMVGDKRTLKWRLHGPSSKVARTRPCSTPLA